jgi:hypothetical protein
MKKVSKLSQQTKVGKPDRSIGLDLGELRAGVIFSGA